MSTVYLDVLFLLNALVDYFLLRAAAHVARRSVRPARLAASAAVGGMLAVLRFCAALPGWFSPVAAAACAVLLCTIAFHFDTFRELTTLCLLFFALSCLYAGLLTAFLQLPQADTLGLQVQNGVGYIELPLMVFVLATLALYLLSGLLYAFPLTQERHAPARLTVHIADAVCTLDALRDTGHDLHDPLTGREAAVVSWSAVRTLFPDAVRAVLDRTLDDPIRALSELGNIGAATGFGLLSCRTVQGHGLLLSFLPHRILVDDTPLALLIALTPQPLSPGGSFQAIIGAQSAL